MKIIIENKGFTILEVVIALGIITMGILGVFSLVIQNTQVQVTNKNHLIGSMLAQEGIELIRQIKDENYLIPGNVWNTNISDYDDSFIVDYRGRGFINDTPDSINNSATQLFFDSTSNFYTHVSAGNATTPFSRIITILLDTANSTVVNCEVQWTDQNRTHSYIAETELHDWR